MPEIPDLEGYRAFLNRRLPGLRVKEATVTIPIVVRAGRDEFSARLAGAVFRPIERRAKYLLVPFDGGDWLVVHAMLTGRFQYCPPEKRKPRRTAFILALENGEELRYYDERLMGKVYLAREEEFAQKLPRWSEMGPDVLDPNLAEEQFVARLKPYRGQIKNVLTTEQCVAGIGNAYSDEVLWEAGIHPLRKRVDLSEEELASLFRAVRSVMAWAIPIVDELMETKGLPWNHYRDHLRVHRKGGQPCPRCGTTVSEIGPGGRVTSFCRTCQK